MAALGWLAGSLITACVLPQLVAALRTSDVSGVSVTGSTYAAASCVGWTIYATKIGLVEVAWSSAIGATLWATIAVVVTVRTARPPSAWVGLWAGSIALSLTVIGIDGLGMLLLLEAATNTVPQALRARRQAAGVSPSAFLTMGIGAACWTVYGLGTGDAPLAVSSATKTAMCVTILELLRPRPRPTLGRWWLGGLIQAEERRIDFALICAHERQEAKSSGSVSGSSLDRANRWSLVTSAASQHDRSP